MKITAVGISIDLVALLAFIGIAQSDLADPGKDMAYIVYVMAMAALLFVAVMRLPVRRLFLLALFLAFGTTVIEQTLGFLFFPGLVKDLVFLSLDQLKATVLATVTFFGIFAGGIVALLALVKGIKALKALKTGR